MPWWRPLPLWPTPPKPSDGSAPCSAQMLTHAPPERGLPQHVLGDLRVLAVDVQAERPLARVDLGHRLAEVVVGDDRQDRAEDLFLHDAQVLRRVDDQHQRQPPGRRVALAAQRDHAGAGLAWASSTIASIRSRCRWVMMPVQSAEDA